MQIENNWNKISFSMQNWMQNWLNLKDFYLQCLNADLIACQFNFKEDQLVQAK